MSGWDTDVAVVTDEAGAQAIATALTSSGITYIIVAQPEALPAAQLSYHVKEQGKDLTTTRLALRFAGQDSLESGSISPHA